MANVHRTDEYFAANAIESETKKRAVLLTCIGPKAYGLLRNLLAPTKPSAIEYTMLIKTMKDHLSLKPIVIAECFKFYKRNQQDGEPVAQYLVVLRKLAEQCDFNDSLNQALHDKLVCGL